MFRRQRHGRPRAVGISRTAFPAMAVTMAVAVVVGLPARRPAAAAPPAGPPASQPADPGKAQREAYEAVADLADKLFFGGKVASVTKTMTEAATYRTYAELCYSMNPVDLLYYATSDYKKELVMESAFVVTRKVTSIATPIVGFEVTIGLDTLEHLMNLKKGQKPFELTPDLKAKFTKACKDLWGAEGTRGKVFDTLFVEQTTGDAIAAIRKIAQSYRSLATQLRGVAQRVRAQQQTRILALRQQIDDARTEAKRLEDSLPAGATPARRAEVQAKVRTLQGRIGALQQQVALCNRRLASAANLDKKAAEQEQLAKRFDTIGDGVRGNRKMLAKLAAYLQKNKAEGIPSTEMEFMIQTFQEVSKKEKDYKGDFLYLVEIAKTKGAGEVLQMATDHVLLMSPQEYGQLVAKAGELAGLGTELDVVAGHMQDLGKIVEAGANVNDSVQAALAYARKHMAKVKKARAGAATLVAGGGTAEEYNALRDLAKEAGKLWGKKADIEKQLGYAKDLLERTGAKGYLLGTGAGQKASEWAKSKVETLTKKRDEILNRFRNDPKLKGALDWWNTNKEGLDAFKEEWKSYIEVVTEVVGLLDKDMPQLDLAPDQEHKVLISTFFAGKGATFTGYAKASDKSSGINPKQVHLFWYDPAAKTNHEITDIKVTPLQQTEFALRATRINEARIRYRFQPPDKGDYVVWGYVRDRAGHASCALANTRCSAQPNHAKWTYQAKGPDEARVLQLTRKLMEELGIDPNEVFRKREFHEVNLKLKIDATPAIVRLFEPANRSQDGIDPSRKLPIHFTVEEHESWFHPGNVQVWITDEYGQLVWEPAPDAKWQITPKFSGAGGAAAGNDQLRYRKTGMMPEATFHLDGVQIGAPGIYFLCVQATNGAHVVQGQRSMFFLGDVKPFVLVSTVRPFRAVYHKGDELRVEHEFHNIKDDQIDQVELTLLKAPGELTVRDKPVLRATGVGPQTQRRKTLGTHTFTVASKPKAAKAVRLLYRCRLSYAHRPTMTLEIPVPINLFNEDAAKTYYLRGQLSYQYQKKTYPVPKGTVLSASQVYKMHAMGSAKLVEQYVGYGEVRNDAGEFFFRIRPAGRGPYRMRLVAKSLAHERRPGTRRAFRGTAAVAGLESSRPVTCITKTITVSRSQANVFKNNVYDVGAQVIPYHSRHLAEYKKWILIPWEGELSTGGYISPYGHDFGKNPYTAYGSFLMTGGLPTTFAKGTSAHGLTAPVPLEPGTIMDTGLRYHNYNGALAILATLVRAQEFSKKLAYLAPDASPYAAAEVPLLLRKGKPPSGGDASAAPVLTAPDGTKISLDPEMQSVIDPDFPYRKIGEAHEEDDLVERHEVTYESDSPPPGVLARKLTREIKKPVVTVKEGTARVFLVADTGKDRVIALYPSGGAPTTLLSDKKQPVSVEQLLPWTYLVCLRGENKVAIYDGRAEKWAFGTDDEKTRDVDESLSTPEFAAATPTESVLICDAGHKRVLDVDIRTKKILWSAAGLAHPVMATMTTGGTYLIADRDAHRVVEMDAGGKELWSFGQAGQAGAGDTGLKSPVSALRTLDGTTVIADAGNARVLLVDRTGKITREIAFLKKVEIDRVTRRRRVTPVPLTHLRFAMLHAGTVYLIQGDVIYRAGPDDAITGEWGRAALAAPEHMAVGSLRWRTRKTEFRIFHEPYYQWKLSVKIHKVPSTDVLIGRTTRKFKLDPTYRKPIEPVGPFANWAPGRRLAAFHGLYSAGLDRNRGRVRIYVDGGNANADQNDPHVIARACGAFLRHRTLADARWRYRYDARGRTGLREAWERGWDTALACVILDDPVFVDRNFLGRPIERSTFDLDAQYAKMLGAYETDPATLQRDYGDYRGIDSPRAIAMALWRIYRMHGAAVISHALTYAQGAPDRGDGGVAPHSYIDPATLLKVYPDMQKPFEVLGLIPKLTLKFPDGRLETLNTSYPRLRWDTNGLVGDADTVDCTLEISEGKPGNVVKRVDAAGRSEWDFGKILNPAGVVASLSDRLRAGKVYFWRVLVEADDGHVRYRTSSPWAAFQIRLDTHVLTSDGGELALARPDGTAAGGRLMIPPGALGEKIKATVEELKAAKDLGDYESITGTIYDIGTGEVTFAKAATLEFTYDEKDLGGRDPRGLGVYRYHEDSGLWDYVGGQVGDSAVRASINHTSIYALLYDKRPPEFRDVADGPDHARTDDTLRIRFGVREPTFTTCLVTDPAGKRVATLCDGKLLTAAANELTLPLTHLPEGRYAYTLTGTDHAGLKAEPVRRTFLVSNAVRGGARGTVSAPEGASPAEVRVFLPDTSIEFVSQAGAGVFSLAGIAPGTYELHVHRPGTFPARRTVTVPSGAVTDLGEISLTHHAVSRVRLTEDLFTPNHDGQDEHAALHYTADRPCTLRLVARPVEIEPAQDSSEPPAATPPTPATMAGHSNILKNIGMSSKPGTGQPAGQSGTRSVRVIVAPHGVVAGVGAELWDGRDARGTPLPSGWYEVQLQADALGVWVPQGAARVLLDRGLVRGGRVMCLPKVFSPNGDGFEDAARIEYELDADATVTVQALSADGRLAATVADGVRQKAGGVRVLWDGKNADGERVPDGRYTLRVLPRYVSGHASLPAETACIADATAPEIVEISPGNGVVLDTGRPVFTARVQADAGDVDAGLLQFKIDEHTVRIDSYDAKTGTFTFRPRTSLGEGLHIAIAYAQDQAGTYAPPKAVSFTVDRAPRGGGKEQPKYIERVAPEVRITSPAADQTVYTATPLIAAVLFDEGSGIDERNIVVHLDGKRVCNSVKRFLPGTSGKPWDWYAYEKAVILYDPMLGEMRYVPGRPLAPGKHHVEIEAMDRLGNRAKRAEAIFTVVVDDKPPVISDLVPAGAAKGKPAPTHPAGQVDRVEATLTDEGAAGVDAASIRLLVDGVLVPLDPASCFDAKTGRFTRRLPAALAGNAQHVILLTVRDRAGNLSRAEARVVTVVRDRQRPRIDVYAPCPPSAGEPVVVKAGANVAISAAVYDLGPAGLDPASLAVTLDGQAAPADDPKTDAVEGYVLAGGVLRWTLSTARLRAGPHVVGLFVRDRAGQGSEQVLVRFLVEAKEVRP